MKIKVKTILRILSFIGIWVLGVYYRMPSVLGFGAWTWFVIIYCTAQTETDKTLEVR